jgi:hypothetical protein
MKRIIVSVAHYKSMHGTGGASNSKNFQGMMF